MKRINKRNSAPPRLTLPDSIKTRRKEIKVEALEKLRVQSFFHKEFPREIRITGSGIDEWLNQPHKHYAEKNEMLVDIGNVIKKSNYMGISSYKGRPAHIFETNLCGEATWIVVTIVPGRGATIYSISDSANILKDIKKPV